ncbi:MAG: ferredoxin [Oscillospiraceae bacterium]|nr:ferredoxin [Oscillospiraceae bacterium]
MKYYVNSTCIGCGLCASMCPEVFTMTDENVSLAADAPVEPAQEDAARQAMESCPVAAIEQVQ